MRIDKATPYNEIARELGLTGEWVKRLHKSALEKIKGAVLKSIEQEKNLKENVWVDRDKMKQLEIKFVILEQRVEQVERQLKMVHNSTHPDVIKTMKINDIPGMTVRVRNVLKREGIITITDLLLREKNDLLKIRSFGKVSLSDLEIVLQLYDIKF